LIDAIEWHGTLHEICIETTVKPIKHGYNLQQVPSVWVGRREGRSVNTFFKNFRYVGNGIQDAIRGQLVACGTNWGRLAQNLSHSSDDHPSSGDFDRFVRQHSKTRPLG